MGVGGGVAEEKLSVLLQGTTAVVEIVDFYLYTFGRAERYEVLLNGIPGETIPDAQDADNKPYGTQYTVHCAF